MVKIDRHSFGSITIGGKKYETDVVISWDGEVIERERSHEFSKKELIDLLMLKDPEIIVVGTGNNNTVKITRDAKRFAVSEGIKLISKPTAEAVKEFNKLVRKEKVLGVIHVTD